MTDASVAAAPSSRVERILNASAVPTLAGLGLLLIGALLLPESVRWVVAPLALLLPGHALLLAVGVDLELDPAPALALRTVASLAVYVLVTVAVGGVGLALTDTVVLAAVVLATLVLVAIGWAREPRPATPTIAAAVEGPGRDGALRHPVIVLTGTLLIALGVLVVGHARSPGVDEPPFTELSLAGDRAAVAPIQVRDGRAGVRVRVGNGSDRARAYVVAATAGAATSWRAVRVEVDAGAAQTVRLAGDVPTPGCPGRIIVRVVPSGASEPVARLTLPYAPESGEPCPNPTDPG